MKIVTNNKNQFTKALKDLVKNYSEEYEGTITVDVNPIKIEKSKLNEWKAFCRDAYRQGEDYYCTEWTRGFKQDNPLAKALMYYIDNIDRYQSVDMIECLDDTLLNDMPKVYILKENWQDTFEGVESILKNPDGYPEELVNDLDSVIAQFYKYHPLFKWDW